MATEELIKLVYDYDNCHDGVIDAVAERLKSYHQTLKSIANLWPAEDRSDADMKLLEASNRARLAIQEGRRNE